MQVHYPYTINFCHTRGHALKKRREQNKRTSGGEETGTELEDTIDYVRACVSVKWATIEVRGDEGEDDIKHEHDLGAQVDGLQVTAEIHFKGGGD
jgi:hypothetical protein